MPLGRSYRLAYVFTGSRDWGDWVRVEEELLRLPRRALIVHGNARGLDRTVGRLAERHGFDVAAEPGDWERHERPWCQCWDYKAPYCKASGFRRNQFMLDKYHPRGVLAFTSPGPRKLSENYCWLGRIENPRCGITPGTCDMIQRSILAGVPCRIITSRGIR